MSEDGKSSEPRTWEQVFGDMIYWTFQGPPPDWSVRSDVGFIERALALTKGAKLLDLGCGLAGHAIELSRRGYDVTGLEWSAPFLEAARRNVAEASVSVRLIRGDMTAMAFEGEFDAVLLWGNTFGMFSHEDNVRTLCGMRRALKAGGRALIDTQNYLTLPEKLDKGWDFHDERDDLLILTEGTRDALNARFGFNVLTIDLTSGARHFMPFSWRLYLLPELKRLVGDAGLTLLGIYGDDPDIADWKSWQRGDACPYRTEAFTENAAKRILLCGA